MRVVYLDSLAALNFCMDYCILRASAQFSGRPATGTRLTAAAGLGAAYAVLCVLVPVCAALPFRLIGVGGMSAMAFGIRQRAGWVRNTLTVLLISFVFGAGFTDGIGGGSGGFVSHQCGGIPAADGGGRAADRAGDDPRGRSDGMRTAAVRQRQPAHGPAYGTAGTHSDKRYGTAAVSGGGTVGAGRPHSV